MLMSTSTLTQVGDRELVNAWLTQGRATGQADPYAGKRRHPRTTWHVNLQIRVPDQRRRGQWHYAVACDVSEGGIGFFCRQRIEPCTRIHVYVENELVGVPAVVMHCSSALGGYQIGAEYRFEPAGQAIPRLAKAG
jgi:hypothetical protein